MDVVAVKDFGPLLALAARATALERQRAAAAPAAVLRHVPPHTKHNPRTNPSPLRLGIQIDEYAVILDALLLKRQPHHYTHTHPQTHTHTHIHTHHSGLA